MNSTNILRHGDVILKAITLPKGAKLVAETPKYIVAYGEATGHNHTLVANREDLIKIYEHDGRMYFLVGKTSMLTHPEHKTITVLPDTYTQLNEREKDWFSLAVRRIID